MFKVFKVLGLRGGGALLAFVLSPLLVKTMPQEDFGLFVFVQAVFTSLSTLFQLGLSRVLIRESKGDTHLKELLFDYSIISFILSCIAFSILVLLKEKLLISFPWR